VKQLTSVQQAETAGNGIVPTTRPAQRAERIPMKKKKKRTKWPWSKGGQHAPAPSKPRKRRIELILQGLGRFLPEAPRTTHPDDPRLFPDMGDD